MGAHRRSASELPITMKLHFISSVILSLLDSSLSQLKFGGSSSSSSSGSNSATNTEQADTDTRFFTGNEAIDGGILGLGAGLLGGAVLGGALNGGGNGCRRRRRQAEGEDQPGLRFFGLETLLGGGNNNCCNCVGSGYNNGYNNGYNTGGGSGRCQCNYNLTFQDKYGQTHGACKRADETGRLWCYTTGYGCSDARQSQRFPSNPWSYQACGSFSGK